MRDSEVYIATYVEPIEPAIPWWKQRRTRFLLGALVVIVITFSIALALSLREDGNTEAPEAQVIVVVNSPVPSFSMAPSSIDISPGATCPMNPDCGATLETWTGIVGQSIDDLMSGTNNFEITPSKTERLGGQRARQPLEVLTIVASMGSRIKGWLMPPATGNYVFWIVADDAGELWLSSDDHPDNKERICVSTDVTGTREWTKFPEQESTLIPLVVGEAYYFEVRP